MPDGLPGDADPLPGFRGCEPFLFDEALELGQPFGLAGVQGAHVPGLGVADGRVGEPHVAGRPVGYAPPPVASGPFLVAGAAQGGTVSPDALDLGHASSCSASAAV